MKLNFTDKITLFFMNTIIGFMAIFYLVSELIPKYPSWEFILAAFILSLSIAWWDVRLIIRLFEEGKE